MITIPDDAAKQDILLRSELAIKQRNPQDLEKVLFECLGFKKPKQSLREDPGFEAYKRQLARAREKSGRGLFYFSQETQDLTDYLTPYIARVKVSASKEAESWRPGVVHGFVRYAGSSQDSEMIVAAYGVMAETFVFIPRKVDHHFFFILRVPHEQQDDLVQLLVHQAKDSPGNPAKVWNHWLRQNNCGTSAMSSSLDPSYGLQAIECYVDFLRGNHEAIKMVNLLGR